MGTGLITDPRYNLHDTGVSHPEQPARCDSILAALEAAGLRKRLVDLEPRPAAEAELLLCHQRDYLDTVQSDIDAGRGMLSTGDTAISAESLTVATLAAGGMLAAVDSVVAADMRNAFCVVRPPGHHAGPSRGMGFCVFNNVAIAARYAQRMHKLQRVAIVDWDVHHGNGTQDVFWRDGSVFYFSTHQAGIYPGTGSANETGEGSGAGTTLNCPFPAGAGQEEILGAVQDKFAPAMESFRPDLLLISAGFDSRKDDPLGGFVLTDEDFAELTRALMVIADKYAQGRVVSVLEGGYNLEGLGLAAAAHVKALLEA